MAILHVYGISICKHLDAVDSEYANPFWFMIVHLVARNRNKSPTKYLYFPFQTYSDSGVLFVLKRVFVSFSFRLRCVSFFTVSQNVFN